MKDHVSLQERLKDLRVEKGLKLEELAEKTGISKSALASYENEENRNKEINHGNLITLADFYEVSIDYLFCRTENREQINTPLSELHLTDEAVALLKSGRINTRLLCEMMSHEKFAELMADAEIYVDGMATMRFHDINSALAAVRAMILEEHPEAAADRSLKILEAGQIEEEDFFCHVTHKTWDASGLPAGYSAQRGGAGGSRRSAAAPSSCADARPGYAFGTAAGGRGRVLYIPPENKKNTPTSGIEQAPGEARGRAKRIFKINNLWTRLRV